ncbi:MAG: hypothetical protein ACRDJP_15925, partial [Actinomycetota bacterium]
AVAVAMIAGALLIRQQLNDDDNGDGGSSSGTGNGDGGPALLVCATELAAACEAVELEGFETRVEPAGVTADALIAGEGELDAWLTVSPWPAMVDGARERAGEAPVFDTTDLPPLARSPLVVVGVAERMEALVSRCDDGEVYWSCLGAVAGLQWGDIGGEPGWGDVRPGHDRLDTSATGLAVLGSAVADFFGTTEISSAEFEQDAFRSWFTRLERAVPRFEGDTGSLLQDLLVIPGSFDAVGATEAEASAMLDLAGARGERLVILYPSAMATADAVLALRAGRDGERLVDAVENAGVAALDDARWHVGNNGDLPEGSGLPSAGVLVRLRQLWSEAAG